MATDWTKEYGTQVHLVRKGVNGFGDYVVWVVPSAGPCRCIQLLTGPFEDRLLSSAKDWALCRGFQV